MGRIIEAWDETGDSLLDENGLGLEDNPIWYATEGPQPPSLLGRYTALFKALLPRGLAFTRRVGTRQHEFLTGLAAEPERIHGRGDDLLDEMDPSRCLEMLTEWETSRGLPGQCLGALETVEQRRQALMARIAFIGGQRPGFFVELARSVGYEVTIDENVGGDHTVWRINAPETTVRWFRAGTGRAGERIRTWGNEILECTINEVAPAHLSLLFGYGG